MNKIEIYTTGYCPYCDRAKKLLQNKNYAYKEINVEDAINREKMQERAKGARTVPQIFINDEHIGGCDDLHTLDRTGELDKKMSK